MCESSCFPFKMVRTKASGRTKAAKQPRKFPHAKRPTNPIGEVQKARRFKPGVRSGITHRQLVRNLDFIIPRRAFTRLFKQALNDICPGHVVNSDGSPHSTVCGIEHDAIAEAHAQVETAIDYIIQTATPLVHGETLEGRHLQVALLLFTHERPHVFDPDRYYNAL